MTELDASDNNDSRKYKVEAICDSVVYTRESVNPLPGLYYLVSWKGYPEEENIWEPSLAIQHLKKLISLFHKDHLNKPTVISEAIDIILLMVKPTVKFIKFTK